MTRPVCPYPQTAVHDGAGDPAAAASFTCADPPRQESAPGVP